MTRDDPARSRAGAGSRRAAVKTRAAWIARSRSRCSSFALATLAWLLLTHVRYRLTHRYDRDDLEAARLDAVKRSRSVLAGKSAEQLAPLLPEFSERFEPSEARFLGAPVDYVIFDGLGSGLLREIVLVEVKTGKSRLTPNEREVEQAISEGRVRFEVIRL